MVVTGLWANKCEFAEREMAVPTPFRCAWRFGNRVVVDVE
jgi:hypothetical protein